jgi:histidyl-tRNA synthetase
MRVWHQVEDVIRRVCESYCAGELRTPIFEHTELFLRGVGESTDVVQKEMYTFQDKANRSLTLRPEITAGAARAFVEHKLYAETLPLKFYYIGPNFRYEKPAAGRWRQFHQFGVEIFGSYDAAAEAEVIAIADTVLRELGITGYTLQLNSLGGRECREKYNNVLKAFLSDNYDKLCPTCQTRFEKNPLRVLDCKDPSCQSLLVNAPTPLDTLGVECKAHFEKLQALLNAMGIKYAIDGHLVRGLDYYTRTVFEFVDDSSGLTVCGGGRYDNLIEECGGPATGAAGFGMGLERIISMLGQPETDKNVDVFAGAMGEAGYAKAQAVANELRRAGVRVEAEISGRGVKAQMKFANKIGARYSFILGDNELQSGRVNVKNMATGEQTECELDKLIDFFSGVEPKK